MNKRYMFISVGAFLTSVSCSRRPEPAATPDVVDIAVLNGTNPAAERDLQLLLTARRPQLARCADPVRVIVQLSPPGYGSVGVELQVVGKRDGELKIRSADVQTRFGPAFDTCVSAALLGDAPPVPATGDYDLRVRAHLCIHAYGAP